MTDASPLRCAQQRTRATLSDTNQELRRIEVLAIIQGEDFPSSRVRIRALDPVLRAANVHVHRRPAPRTRATRRAVVEEFAGHVDAVLVQKRAPSWADRRMLTRLRAPLLFDVDDGIQFRHEDRGGGESGRTWRRLRRFLPRTALLIVGNALLAEDFRDLAPRIEVLPSAVPVDVPVAVHAPKDAGAPLVVGWVGGTNNLIHAGLLLPVLRRLAQRHPIEYRILSGAPLDTPEPWVTFVPWSEAGQGTVLAGFDVGVMPLPDTPHARRKCAYKALQYMAAGVPAVVSRVGANAEFLREGTDGFLADDLDAFGAHLERLASSWELRATLGAAGRESVTRAYSVPVIGARLAELLRRAVAPGPA
jgi:glycosyltransferase involved in cell wall biosynthesis